MSSSNQFFYVTMGLTACLAGVLIFSKLPTHNKIEKSHNEASVSHTGTAAAIGGVKKQSDPLTQMNNKIIQNSARATGSTTNPTGLTREMQSGASSSRPIIASRGTTITNTASAQPTSRAFTATSPTSGTRDASYTPSSGSRTAARTTQNFGGTGRR